MPQLIQRIIQKKNPIIESRGVVGCLTLVIRREGRGAVRNVIFIHATTIADEVHLVYLPLVLHLQLLLLGSKPEPKLLHLLPQMSVLPFRLLAFGPNGLSLFS